MSGTLCLSGPGSVQHLDPIGTVPHARQLSRLFTRQLFTYRPMPDLRDWRAIDPVPDLAVDIPSTYNAGLGASHLSYTVHLRPGVMWDSTPPRPVTTHDVVRAFKRMGNPVLRPATIGYFTSTIRGMAEYCANYAEAMAGSQPAAQELAAYQDSHDIPGVFALDDETMIFELVRPALDFITMLALPEASPIPVEYDQYLPGSPELHANLRSNGPYRIVRYAPDSVRLEPNPVWRRETDPVRQRLLDAVEVTTGSATADLAWGLPATAASDEPPRHRLGHALDPYLVLNMSTLDNPDVRRAIAYAVDKAAIAEVFDQHKVAGVRVPARSMIPPGNVGHRDDFDPYPTDPHHARTLLPAGGVTVTVLCRDIELDLAVTRSYVTDLERIGVAARIDAVPDDEFHRILRDPANAKAGRWDIAPVSRTPDWYHLNGRVFAQPMAQSNDFPGTVNYGGYSSEAVDALVEKAHDLTDPGPVQAIWHEIDKLVMQDVAIVPILSSALAPPFAHGPRVRDAVPMPALGGAFDLSTIRLAE